MRRADARSSGPANQLAVLCYSLAPIGDSAPSFAAARSVSEHEPSQAQKKDGANADERIRPWQRARTLVQFARCLHRHLGRSLWPWTTHWKLELISRRSALLCLNCTSAVMCRMRSACCAGAWIRSAQRLDVTPTGRGGPISAATISKYAAPSRATCLTTSSPSGWRLRTKTCLRGT